MGLNLREYLPKIELGEMQRHENIAVMPLFIRDEGKIDYLILRVAMAFLSTAQVWEQAGPRGPHGIIQGWGHLADEPQKTGMLRIASENAKVCIHNLTQCIQTTILCIHWPKDANKQRR
jgi:hypothetical protein